VTRVYYPLGPYLERPISRLSVNWVDHSKTLREQGIVESDVLLLKRKYFYSDANIDSRDPVQLNLVPML